MDKEELKEDIINAIEQFTHGNTTIEGAAAEIIYCLEQKLKEAERLETFGEKHGLQKMNNSCKHTHVLGGDGCYTCAECGTKFY